ncbi:Uncharacterised protein [Mycobacteroides abscessus subsp. massiliense]|nr:Uncharacterised protein [Mycobacteroides abscessus subsp. massiliense]
MVLLVQENHSYWVLLQINLNRKKFHQLLYIYQNLYAL